MDIIDSGVEKISVYRPEFEADLETLEQVYGRDLDGYGIESVRIAGPEENRMDMAAEAVEGLLTEDLYDEDFFGIFTSSNVFDGPEASRLARRIQRDYDISFSTDGAPMSDSRMIQNAAAHHQVRAREGEYSIAVSSSEGMNGLEGSAAVAYLIGDDPFLKLSERGGLEQGPENEEYSFDDTLSSMKDALDGFIREATQFEFPGVDVTGNNSNLVNPQNIDYALFNIPETNKKVRAAARGWGRIARHADEFDLPFDSDPDTRDPEAYRDNLLNSDEFREFYERAVKPALELENSTGVVSPGALGLQRVSALEDGEEGGIIMVGSMGLGGINAEVHAEEVVGQPEIVYTTSQTQSLDGEELKELRR